MTKSTKRRFAVAVLLALPWVPGCGGATDENLSTRAESDPDKLKKAQAESEALAAKAKATEAKRTKGRIKVEEP